MYNKLLTTNPNPPKKMCTFFEIPEKKSYPPKINAQSKLIQKRGTQHFQGLTGQDFVDKYNEWVRKVNNDLFHINNHIELYNQLTEPEKKLQKLQEIYNFYQSILKQHSGNLTQYCPEFNSKIQKGIFEAIQSEAKTLGIASMRYFEITQAVIPVNSQSRFTELLLNMDSTTLSQLLTMLMGKTHFKQEDFKKLYDKHSESIQFNEFLTNLASLVFYRGGNSYLYKMTFKDGSPPLILKVDSRLGNPTKLEDSLRKDPDFQGVFIEIYAERQVNTVINGQPITRSIQLTEFCCGEDLLNTSLQLDIPNRLISASDIFIKMAQLFILLHSKGCGHPDPKLSNFLKQGDKLRLGDTKTLVPLTKDACFNFKLLATNWFALIATEYIRPPEYGTRNYYADAASAYSLGKNLYHFLTACHHSYLEKNHEGSLYEFSDAIFNTPEGRVFKHLIAGLVKLCPDQRIPLQHALMILQDMNLDVTAKRANTWLLITDLWRMGAEEGLLKELYAELFDAKADTIDQIQAKINQIHQDYTHDLTLKRTHCKALLITLYSTSDEKYQFYLNNINHYDVKELDKVLTRLEAKRIALEVARKNCEDYLVDIAACTYGENDGPMDHFLKKYKPLIQHAKINTISKLEKKLGRKRDDILPAKKAIEEVFSTIQQKGPRFYNKTNRVAALRTILLNLPVKERGSKILQLDYPKNITLLKRAVFKHPFFNNFVETQPLVRGPCTCSKTTRYHPSPLT